FERGAQVYAGIDPAAGAAQVLAVAEVDARPVESARGGASVLDRLLELAGRVRMRRRHAPSPTRPPRRTDRVLPTSREPGRRIGRGRRPRCGRAPPVVSWGWSSARGGAAWRWASPRSGRGPTGRGRRPAGR